jgi:hypothetical protein
VGMLNLVSWRTWVLHTYIPERRWPNGNLYIDNWISRPPLIIVNCWSSLIQLEDWNCLVRTNENKESAC